MGDARPGRHRTLGYAVTLSLDQVSVTGCIAAGMSLGGAVDIDDLLIIADAAPGVECGR